jgi:hypothetical protein
MIINMKLVLSGLLLASSAVLATAPVHASLLEVDFISGGDRLLTRDTASGLEWLDLTTTVGLSWNSLVHEGAGGWLAQGFRHATTAEVSGLFSHAGISQTPPVWAVTGEAAQVSNLLQLIGITETGPSGRKKAFGITASEAAPGFHVASCLGVRGNGLTSAVVECKQLADTAVLVGNAGYSTGHYLVREASAVPLPGAVFLFGSGLIGMLPLMRRKHHAN